MRSSKRRRSARTGSGDRRPPAREDVKTQGDQSSLDEERDHSETLGPVAHVDGVDRGREEAGEDETAYRRCVQRAERGAIALGLSASTCEPRGLSLRAIKATNAGSEPGCLLGGGYHLREMDRPPPLPALSRRAPSQRHHRGRSYFVRRVAIDSLPFWLVSSFRGAVRAGDEVSLARRLQVDKGLLRAGVRIGLSPRP